MKLIESKKGPVMSKHRATGNPRGRPSKIPFDLGERILASFRRRVDPGTGLVRCSYIDALAVLTLTVSIANSKLFSPNNTSFHLRRKQNAHFTYLLGLATFIPIRKWDNSKNSEVPAFGTLMVAREGFEPSQAASKAAVLTITQPGRTKVCNSIAQ